MYSYANHVAILHMHALKSLISGMCSSQLAVIYVQKKNMPACMIASKSLHDFYSDIKLHATLSIDCNTWLVQNHNNLSMHTITTIRGKGATPPPFSPTLGGSGELTCI